jgi:hypothetical protein
MTAPIDRGGFLFIGPVSADSFAMTRYKNTGDQIRLLKDIAANFSPRNYFNKYFH